MKVASRWRKRFPVYFVDICYQSNWLRINFPFLLSSLGNCWDSQSRWGMASACFWNRVLGSWWRWPTISRPEGEGLSVFHLNFLPVDRLSWLLWPRTPSEHPKIWERCCRCCAVFHSAARPLPFFCVWEESHLQTRKLRWGLRVWCLIEPMRLARDVGRI